MKRTLLFLLIQVHCIGCRDRSFKPEHRIQSCLKELYYNVMEQVSASEAPSDINAVLRNVVDSQENWSLNIQWSSLSISANPAIEKWRWPRKYREQVALVLEISRRNDPNMCYIISFGGLVSTIASTKLHGNLKELMHAGDELAPPIVIKRHRCCPVGIAPNTVEERSSYLHSSNEFQEASGFGNGTTAGSD